MHFSTIVASALALVLASSTITTTVSAQTPAPACLACILEAAIEVSPTCDMETLNSGPSGTDPLTPKQKSCICPLTANDSWIQPCTESAAGGCTAGDISTGFQNLLSFKAQACDADAAVAPAPSGTTTPVAPAGPSATTAVPSASAPASPSKSVAPGTANPNPTTTPKGNSGAYLAASSSATAGVALAFASF
ncbi:hypothetical protein BGX29_000383 [Mortierella sp. GBA35]|nr:hypothetical protein BGX29_000383 [Mortierella sp. GBA35]